MVNLECPSISLTTSSVTQYYYNTNNQIIADSTYYYHNNKPDYLGYYTVYFYDSITDKLLVEKEYDRERRIKTHTLYKTINANTEQETEIRYEYYSKTEIDTAIATYTYDDKKRLLKELHKTKSFGWKRECEYDEEYNRKHKFYYDTDKSLYPEAFDFIELNKQGKPTKIEHANIRRGSFTYYTTLISYNQFGLEMEEEEICSWDRCNENGVKAITNYEYEYYK